MATTLYMSVKEAERETVQGESYFVFRSGDNKFYYQDNNGDIRPFPPGSSEPSQEFTSFDSFFVSTLFNVDEYTGFDYVEPSESSLPEEWPKRVSELIKRSYGVQRGFSLLGATERRGDFMRYMYELGELNPESAVSGNDIRYYPVYVREDIEEIIVVGEEPFTIVTDRDIKISILSGVGFISGSYYGTSSYIMARNGAVVEVNDKSKIKTQRPFIVSLAEESNIIFNDVKFGNSSLRIAQTAEATDPSHPYDLNVFSKEYNDFLTAVKRLYPDYFYENNPSGKIVFNRCDFELSEQHSVIGIGQSTSYFGFPVAKDTIDGSFIQYNCASSYKVVMNNCKLKKVATLSFGSILSKPLMATGNFTLNNCDIDLVNCPIYNGQGSGLWIKNIVIKNCRINYKSTVSAPSNSFRASLLWYVSFNGLLLENNDINIECSENTSSGASNQARLIYMVFDNGSTTHSIKSRTCGGIINNRIFINNSLGDISSFFVTNSVVNSSTDYNFGRVFAIKNNLIKGSTSFTKLASYVNVIQENNLIF